MPSSGYRFGSFVVDRVGYRALRDNVPLDLTPRLLDARTPRRLLVRGVRL